MKSSKQTTQSAEVQDGQSTDSVYDFLYHDAPRVASFLAQFDKSGLLTQIVQGEGTTKTTQDVGGATLEGGVPLVLRGEGTISTTNTEERRRDGQRVYDPMWANALALLDFLSKRGLIKRKVTVANIGQFVLCKGELRIADLQLMHKTWQLPSIKKAMLSGLDQNVTGNRAERRQAKATKGAASSGRDGLDLFWDMVTILPHTLQARLSGEAEVWCNLNQGGLSGPASDIILKHGTYLQGAWAILGILDAKPDKAAPQEQTPDFADAAEMAVKVMDIIAPVARNLLGRPRTSYGITPLMIFREVAE